MTFSEFEIQIRLCCDCEKRFGFKPIPIIHGDSNAKIFQISQAPSNNVHITKRPFNDNTGKKLKYEWYKITDSTFYNPANFYISAFSHCFPGKNNKGGDKVPTKYCADKWLRKEMSLVDNCIYVIIGRKASSYFFPKIEYRELIFNDQTLNGKKTFIIPHPSPLNRDWLKKNPDFEDKRILYIRRELWKTLNLK